MKVYDINDDDENKNPLELTTKILIKNNLHSRKIDNINQNIFENEIMDYNFNLNHNPNQMHNYQNYQNMSNSSSMSSIFQNNNYNNNNQIYPNQNYPNPNYQNQNYFQNNNYNNYMGQPNAFGYRNSYGYLNSPHYQMNNWEYQQNIYNNNIIMNNSNQIANDYYLKRGKVMWYTDEIDNFIIKICKKAIENCIKSNDNKNKKKQACNIIKSLKQLIKGEWFAFICEESQDNFDFKFSHINEENIMIFRYKGYEIYICLLYISLKVSANFDEEKTILNDDNNQNDIKNIIMKNDNIAKKNENKDEIINNQENNIIKNQVSIEFNNNEIKNNNNNNKNNFNLNDNDIIKKKDIDIYNNIKNNIESIKDNNCNNKKMINSFNISFGNLINKNDNSQNNIEKNIIEKNNIENNIIEKTNKEKNNIDNNIIDKNNIVKTNREKNNNKNNLEKNNIENNNNKNNIEKNNIKNNLEKNNIDKNNIKNNKDKNNKDINVNNNNNNQPEVYEVKKEISYIKKESHNNIIKVVNESNKKPDNNNNRNRYYFKNRFNNNNNTDNQNNNNQNNNRSNNQSNNQSKNKIDKNNNHSNNQSKNKNDKNNNHSNNQSKNKNKNNNYSNIHDNNQNSNQKNHNYQKIIVKSEKKKDREDNINKINYNNININIKDTKKDNKQNNMVITNRRNKIDNNNTSDNSEKSNIPDDIIEFSKIDYYKEDVPVNNTEIVKNTKVYNFLQTKVKRLLAGRRLPQFKYDNYKIQRIIGQGTYGQLYYVINKNTQKKYAMKEQFNENLQYFDDCIKTYEINYKNKHPNILDIYGIYPIISDENLFIVFALMDLAECDWEQEVERRRSSQRFYTENELISILKQLVGALAFLQKRNIAHRDIKLENILVFSKNGLNLRNSEKIYKICDFGEAKQRIKYNTKHNTVRGTDYFMSPELLRGYNNQMNFVKNNPHKSDVFSLGCCFIIAATLNYNFIDSLRNEDKQEELDKIVRSSLEIYYSDKLINIFTKMITYNEYKRIDFIDLEKLINKEFG